MVHVAKGAIVCDDGQYEGEIIIGATTVVHPKCRLIAAPGTSITIGEGNIIEEGVLIESYEKNIRIGNHNMIQVRTHIKDSSVGDRCVLQCNTSLHELALLPDQSFVGLQRRLDSTTGDLKQKTAYYGKDAHHALQMRPDDVSLDAEVHAAHLAYLADILPKYHHLLPDAT